MTALQDVGPRVPIADLTGPEAEFVDRARRGTRSSLTGSDAARTVRAEVVSDVLTGRHGDPVGWTSVDLQGAVIPGALTLGPADVRRSLRLQECRLESADFTGTTFHADVTVDDCRVDGELKAERATFHGTVRLNGTTFGGTVVLQGAVADRDLSLRTSTFQAGLNMDRVRVLGELDLVLTKVHALNTRFSGALVDGRADFAEATLTTAYFHSTRFATDADFSRCTFAHGLFWSADFGARAVFDDAVFAGDAKFDGARAATWMLNRTRFASSDPGPWLGQRVELSGAVIESQSRIEIAAEVVVADRLQAREGVHLVVDGASVDLTDAAFLRPSIVADTASNGAVTPIPPGPDAAEELVAVRTPLQATSDASTVRRSRLTSLRRSDVHALTLSGLDLSGCRFRGAHGLDELRVDASCTFLETGRRWPPLTRRTVLFEEASWRARHSRDWEPDVGRGEPPPPALEVAALYRELRKGLEDTRNEPGAADFYYGEMEMRRLAGRESDASDGAAGAAPPRSERWLLNAYWALSGYGLRASRALCAFAALLVVSAWLFTSESFAQLPASSEAAGFPRALEFAARESLSLLRTGSALLDTRGPGTVLDIALRLLGPVLLALAVLAVRGRTKR